MMLHHIATIVVILSAFSINQYVIAAYVLFIHDFSDVFIFLVRFSNDFTAKINL